MTTMVATPPNPKGNRAHEPQSLNRRTSVFKKLFFIILLIAAFAAGAYLQAGDNKIANIATDGVTRGLEAGQGLVDRVTAETPAPEVAPTPAPVAPEATPVVPDQQ